MGQKLSNPVGRVSNPVGRVSKVYEHLLMRYRILMAASRERLQPRGVKT
jgi:hypothetical protein